LRRRIEEDEGNMSCNADGRMVEEGWQTTAEIRQPVESDAFVVMPNHVHGIIVITHLRNGKRTKTTLSS